jgi:transcription elongation factor Elf1
MPNSQPSIRAVPAEITRSRTHRVYTPHQSRGKDPAQWCVTYDQPIPETWARLATEKGFRITRRVHDRYHIALECLRCGAETIQKAFNLRTAMPRCGECVETRLHNMAKAAGLHFKGRCEDNHQYGLYDAPCGHQVRRQFGFVERIARGEVAARCDTCLAERHDREAAVWDWALVGPDPDGHANYRLYRHKTCGHEQRHAQVNMAWGQIDCASCGTTWAARPSYIYLLSITIKQSGLQFLKLGHSKHPEKRFRHQLGLAKTTQVDVLRVVAMPNGNTACSAEKRTHAELRRRIPEAVLPLERFAGHINVISEIYAPAAEGVIQALLDRIEAEVTASGG